jgi:NADH-quinone oxidoreductase subunit G
VLRVLGNLLGLEGFAHETVQDVRAEALGAAAVEGLDLRERLDNSATVDALGLRPRASAGGIERVADVPIYATDMLVRRSPPLQATADAAAPVASVPSALWRSLKLAPGARVLVAQGQGAVVLAAREDPTLADGTVRVPAGHPATVALGPMFGPLSIEAAREGA